MRDTNHNFVDDLIEAQAGQMKVIVDINQCIGNPNASRIIQFLKRYGDIAYIGKYLSFVVVVGIDRSEAAKIAARPEVAMVELSETDKWLGDNYRAAKVQKSTTYGTNTLEGIFGWPTTLNGSGVGIAFLDTGVDNSYPTAQATMPSMIMRKTRRLLTHMPPQWRHGSLKQGAWLSPPLGQFD